MIHWDFFTRPLTDDILKMNFFRNKIKEKKELTLEDYFKNFKSKI